MQPASYDLRLTCGATLSESDASFTYSVGGVPVDLTGARVRFVIRSLAGAVLLDASSDDGGVVVNPTAGSFYLTATAAQTSSWWSDAAPRALDDKGVRYHTLGSYRVRIERGADVDVVMLGSILGANGTVA